MTQPTIVDFHATATGTGSSKTVAKTWQTGDLLVIIFTSGNGTTIPNLPTYSGGTFTRIDTDLTIGGANAGARFSSIATSGGTGNITCTLSGGSAAWVAGVWVIRDHSGLGNHAQSQAGSGVSPATLSLTNSGADSAVLGMWGDFNAIASGFTGTPTVNAERLDAQISGQYTVWAGDWNNQSGTVSYGPNLATGYKWTKMLVEVLGISGSPITPVTLTVTPQALTRSTSDNVSKSVSPIAMTLTPVALATSVGGVTASISPVTITVTPVALTSTTTQSASISPVVFTLGPQAVATSIGGVTASISPVVFTLGPQALTRSTSDNVSKSITPITITLTPVALTATATYFASINPVVLTLGPQSVATSVGGVTSTLGIATITLNPVELTVLGSLTTIAFKNVAVTATNHTTGATSRDLAVANPIAVGDAVFIWVVCDNSGTSGAKPTVGVTDDAGNTYTLLKDQNRTAASAANDGTYSALFGTIATGALTTSQLIHMSFSPSTAAKVYGGMIFTGITSLSLVSSNSSGGSASTYTSNTSGSVGIGNLVIGVTGQQNGTAAAADTDTTNGSWTSYTSVAGLGGDPVSQAARVGYKITSGASGAQTYNGSNGATREWTALIVELAPSRVGSITPATMTLSPVASVMIPGNVSKSISPVVMTLTPITLTNVVGDASRSISPITMTLGPVGIAYSVGAVSRGLTPVTLTLGPVALTYNLPGIASISPVTLTLEPRTLAYTVPGIATISPVTLTLGPRPFSTIVGGTSSSSIVPATFTLTPVTLAKTIGGISRGISPVSLHLTPVTIIGRTGGRPRVWTGSAWVKKPVKVWNGSAWVERPLLFWNGTEWKLV